VTRNSSQKRITPTEFLRSNGWVPIKDGERWVRAGKRGDMPVLLGDAVQAVVDDYIASEEHVRVVIYHDTLGVYLGGSPTRGLWSNVAPMGQTSAVTFESAKHARAVMAKWEHGRSEYASVEFVTVCADVGMRASREACAEAGLPKWKLAGEPT